jgi:hypothetical protein
VALIDGRHLPALAADIAECPSQIDNLLQVKAGEWVAIVCHVYFAATAIVPALFAFRFNDHSHGSPFNYDPPLAPSAFPRGFHFEAFDLDPIDRRRSAGLKPCLKKLSCSLVVFSSDIDPSAQSCIGF